MITGVQIIGIIFGLLMAYFTFLHRKRREFSRTEAIAWLALWAGLIVLMVIPNALNIFTEKLGIVRAFDLFAIVGFIVILSLSYHNYVVIGILKKKLEENIRSEALKDIF
ncbi:MAG TPA: DUF2304 domain-containing protein [Patescibacteria group bacterium]|nr:DUF2304 domain-containing protein [Patescibacteria group bacterium]